MANSNFATLNPLTKGSRSTLDDGGLTHVSTTADLSGVNATMGITSGKWYWEVYVTDSGSGYFYLGLTSGFEGGGEYYQGYSYLNGLTGSGIRYRDNGTVSDDTAQDDPDRWGTVSVSSTGVSTIDNGDIVMVALDYDNKKLWFGKNGTFYNSGNPATGTNAQASWDGAAFGGRHPIYPLSDMYYNGNKFTFNFGQDSSFAGRKSTGSATAADSNSRGDFYYTPPSGFLAVCSANLPTKEEIDPVETDDNYPQKQFDVALYAGTNATQTINIGFQPDLVWWKNRGTSNSHIIADSSRGVAAVSQINNNAAETNAYQTYFTAFASTGPTFASNDVGTNQTGNNYAALCWRCNGGVTATNTSGTITSTVQVNQDNGLAIVQYTGNGTDGASIGHGLGKAPEYIMVKNRDANDDWAVYHVFNGPEHYMILNSQAGKVDNTYWYDTTPTSTVFTVGTDHKLNASTEKYIAYCWTSIEGFSAFGGWNEANANSQGPFVHTGFKPKCVMIKMTVTGDRWGWLDSRRSTVNPRQVMLQFGTDSAGEYNQSAFAVDFYATGFQVASSNAQVNHPSYDPYIYMAWADVPGKFMQGG